MRRLREERADAGIDLRHEMAAREPQVDREYREADRAERHEADLDLAPRQLLAEQRPDADSDREHREEQREHVLAAAQHVARVRRQLREIDRAVEPEPGDAEHRAPDDDVLVADLQVAPRLAQRVPVDPEPRIDRGRLGNRAACEPAQDRDGEDQRRNGDEPTRLDRDHEAAGDRPEQDGHERAHLDKPVAAGELGVRQMLRQDRVLDGAEQRRVDAEERKRGEQEWNVLPPQAERADRHDRDLEELDPADQPRLLELVRELPRGRREQHEREDEYRADQVDDRGRVERRRRHGLERHEHDERVLEDVVVPRTQELRPEERRETALAQKIELVRLVHVSSP
jgi:hypothetical protein